MIGESNVSQIVIEGIETKGLIDTGSMVTTITEQFYNNMEPRPELLPLEDFDLEITAANGTNIPYLGYIEVSIVFPFLQTCPLVVPVLVVPNKEGSESVPCVVGTNVIRLCKENTLKGKYDSFPQAWEAAFTTIGSDVVGVVKSTRRLVIQPNEVRTVTGILRKNGTIEAAVTEPCSIDNYACRINVCPRLITAQGRGKTARVPVRVCNMSVKPIVIPPRTNICELKTVQVIRNVDFKTEVSISSMEIQPSSDEVEDERPLREQYGVDIDETNLTDEQKQKVKNLFRKWEQIFPKSKLDLGHTDVIRHKIVLSDDTPFKEPYRRVPPALYQEVKEHLQEMLKIGAIRDSCSPWSSNVVIVRKKDGTIRFCIDFRKLNKRTIKDAYSIPRVEDTLHLLSGAKYFSKLDLKSGYWQVELDEEDKPKTAFSVGGLGFFECNRMPFGLSNAPATFQRLMERCMGDLNLRDCLIYLDDIIIFSDDIDSHLDRLDKVFSRLSSFNLKIKPAKCEFFKTKTTYLGHVVSSSGIEADPGKTEAVRTWPVPKTVKEVRKFLGFVGYYRRFIKDFSKIARPLNDLLIGHPTSKSSKQKPKTQKRVPFRWEDPQQIAFDSLKEKLCHPPILAYADYSLPFTLHTDASLAGLGAVLYQRQDGKDRVVAYASRSLKPAERNYPAHKLECLALKWAVTDKFHDYLYGATFDVVTDNNPLTYVNTTAKLDAAGQRWVAALANYNFSLKYRAGSQNSDADGMSRIPRQTEESVQPLLKSIVLVSSTEVTTNPLCFSLVSPKSIPELEKQEVEPSQDILQAHSLSSKDWRAAQLQDSVLFQIHNLIGEGLRPPAIRNLNSPIDKYRRVWDRLEIHDGVLYHIGSHSGQKYRQLVLPENLRFDVFQSLHDDLGHQGRDRTTSLFKQRFYWPGMDSYIKDKVAACPRCIRRKSLSSTAPLVTITSSAPMDIVCLDYLSLERSKGGFEHILVVTDHFTRYAQAYPTTNQTARTTARILFEKFFVHYGFPTRIHSDQGANFESDLIKELCQLAGMVKTHTTPYHPMGNGMVERFNQTLLKMLGTLSEDKKSDWKSHVGPLVHAYNVTVHPSTGFSPYFLMFGRQPKLAVDALLGLGGDEITAKTKNEYARKLRERLTSAYEKARETALKAAETNKEYYDKKVKSVELNVGDLVLVRNVGVRGKHKIADNWEDQPYVVIAQPFSGQPVYDVKQDKPNARKIRRLHRNLLLPLQVTKNEIPPKYIIPQRRDNYSSSAGDSDVDDEIMTSQRPKRRRRTPDRYQANDWRR